jgi:hypothetical protein
VPPVEALDLLDVRPLFFEFAFEPVDYLVCAVFVPLGVQDEKRFVFGFHRIVLLMVEWALRPVN